MSSSAPQSSVGISSVPCDQYARECLGTLCKEARYSSYPNFSDTATKEAFTKDLATKLRKHDQFQGISWAITSDDTALVYALISCFQVMPDNDVSGRDVIGIDDSTEGSNPERSYLVQKDDEVSLF